MLPAPLMATIEREQPVSTLLIRHASIPPMEGLPPGVTQIKMDEVLRGEFNERVELVFICDECLHCEKDRLMQLVAKSRDVLSSRVLLECGSDAALKEEDMLALAFSRYAITDADNREYRYYYFDLKTYKTVPDWLNPKFWANPQNWDKFRW